MRLVLLFALSAVWAAPALAADAPPTGSEPAAELPVCTTVTTVVKRGEVVLSTNSTTRCEEAGRAGIGLHPGKVLAAPESVLAAPAALFGSVSLGHGDRLRLKNTAGDWRVIDRRTGAVCHLVLSVRTNAAGFVARGEGCHGEIGEARAWTFRDGAAEVLRADGRLIVRLTGSREEIAGSTADGDTLTLQR